MEEATDTLLSLGTPASTRYFFIGFVRQFKSNLTGHDDLLQGHQHSVDLLGCPVLLQGQRVLVLAGAAGELLDAVADEAGPLRVDVIAGGARELGEFTGEDGQVEEAGGELEDTGIRKEGCWFGTVIN